ncbi:MAG: InlB B-repeat-containing protein, partial [Eubacteriales bacterium]
TAPTRTGYSFSGWSKSQLLPQIVSWPYSMEAFISTFYAVWTPKNYTVSFDPFGGKINNTSGIKSSTVSFENSYGAGTLGFPTPIKVGSTFNGWFTAGGVRIYADTIVQITATQTLTASWTLNGFTVTYDLNNGGTGTPPSAFTASYGTPVPLPTSGYANAKPGYSFLGWNTTNSATTGLSSFAVPEGGATLYAVWQVKKYTVSFNLNGGTGEAPVSIYDNFGTPVDVSMTGFTKTGYTFGGWATSATATVADKLTSYSIPSQTVTLYAIWSGNSHTITLFSNGGVGQTSLQIHAVVGTTVDLSSYNNYSKEGYTFIGWNTSQSATTGFWSYNTPTSSTTLLFAIYYSNADITVSFNLNGATGTVPDDQIGITGTVISLPPQGDIAKPFHIFLGWATASDATTPLESYEISTEDIVLYAIWSRVDITLTAKEGSTTIVDDSNGFIYGLAEGMTKSTFINNFITVNGDGQLRVTFEESFGTGTKVEVIDRVTSAVVKTYYIVIFGDVDGDGYITVGDENLIGMAAYSHSSFADGSAYKYAADLNQDALISTLDLAIISASTNYTGIINQTNPGVLI